MPESPSLSPGVGFHLDGQGQWKPAQIPPEVLTKAKFSGYLTIEGYRASVFETPDGDQWAQKSTGTPSTASSDVFVSQFRRRNSMGPKQTADHLRQIASKLDNSKNPDKTLVVRDLKKILANMDAPPPPPMGGGEQQSQQQQEGQQQQEALPQSGAGKGMLKKMLEDAQAALDKGDEAGFKTLLDKLNKHS